MGIWGLKGLLEMKSSSLPLGGISMLSYLLTLKGVLGFPASREED